MVSPGGADTSISVLGGFDVLSRGERLNLPEAVQRMLGFLAVTGKRQCRSTVAGRLWPLIGEARAQGNLRTALWQLRRTDLDVVRAVRDQLWLSEDVALDFRAMTEQAWGVLSGDLSATDVLGLSLPLFQADLLPDWDEDWLLIERERHRQLRLHALEAVSHRLVELGRHALAAEAAYAAITVEPLCESAHRTLAQVFLAEGNPTEALRQFELYRALLDDETGYGPTDAFVALITAPRRPRGTEVRLMSSGRWRPRDAGGPTGGRQVTKPGGP